MSEPPRELQSLGLDAAVAMVAAVRRQAWVDVALGAIAGGGAAMVASFVSGRWLVAALAACVVFPLVARLSRRTRLVRLRVGLGRLDEAMRAREVAAAWAAASPGQRAALQMILKKPS